MDCQESLESLLSDEGKAAIVQLHVDGIKAYVDNSSEEEGEILTDSYKLFLYSLGVTPFIRKKKRPKVVESA